MRRHGKTEPRSDRPLPIFWTERAIDDLEAIGAYIANDNPIAAERWVEEIIAAVEVIADLPLSGRCVPELGRQDIREILRRSYRIVYRVGTERLGILTVFEGHRLWPSTL